MSAVADEAAGASRTGIIEGVAAYYTGKLREHGPSPRGVDWKDEASQMLRFAQLMGVARDLPDGSVTDFGCGYGELLGWMRRSGFRGPYLGLDVAETMIAAARARFPDDPAARFEVGNSSPAPTDFAVASGIFNVRLGFPTAAWEAHVRDTLDELFRVGKRGFACNFLTAYSDPPRMRADLYYAEPAVWFDYSVRRFGRHVALLHDYGLYEFTLIVRKP